MSQQLEWCVTRTVEDLEALARDLRRPRPSGMTPEESDKRIAAKLDALAKKLQEALPKVEQVNK